MRTLLRIGLLLLTAASCFAQPSGDPAPGPTNSAAPAAISAEDINALREALNAQQKQIAEQQRQIDALRLQVQRQNQMLASLQRSSPGQLGTELASAATTGSPAANPEGTAVTNVNSSAIQDEAEQKRASALAALLGRFRWSGDIRLRQEDFFLVGQQARIRERIRLRFGVEGALGRDFVGGIAVASGTLADPTTTNETLTNFFERKIIGFDRGYITYNPQAHKWLSLTGGKFTPAWQRTYQLFDPDVNPEGFTEKLSFDLKHAVIKNLTLSGMQLLFNENSNVKHGINGGDSFAVGGQVATALQFRGLRVNPSYTLLNWRNDDAILNAPAFSGGFAVTGNTNITCAPLSVPAGGGTVTPNCGFAVGPLAPNGLTNAFRIVGVDSRGNLIRQYVSKFLNSDLILDSTVDTGRPRWPWRVLLEYEDNLRAASNASHIYLAQTSLGRTNEKGDLLFGYAFLHQEQDSTISSFVESDQRLPTNVLQHRFYAQAKLQKNVVAAYSLWVGRVLNSSLFAPVPNPFGFPGAFDNTQAGLLAPNVSPGQVDKYLKRMQFDLIYSF